MMPSQSDRYRQRRQRALNRLGDGVLVLPTAPLRLRNGDVFHEFRPSSDFYYLTGFAEPESVLVAHRTSAAEHHAALFVRPRDPERELWDGRRAGTRGALRQCGVEEAFPIESLYERIETTLLSHQRLFYTFGVDSGRDRDLQRIFERNRIADYRANPAAHPIIEDPAPVIASERLVKDREEVATLSEASSIAAAGHREAMRVAAPGVMEYELQAELEATFRRAGSVRNGYPSIVASGSNACILHYIENDRKMRRGDLVLVDAGCEVGMYTADITRTFPVSGTFTEVQAQVYRIVLKAQKDAIRAVRSGRAWNAPHQAAVRAVTRGLIELGVLRGNPKKLIEKGAYRRWFMHGTSHWLGMDVHDAGGYQSGDGTATTLKPGMALTIEPGLYFSPRDKTIPKKLRGIGIRIEDDVVVTRSGARVLTDGVPKEVRDIESLCHG